MGNETKVYTRFVRAFALEGKLLGNFFIRLELREGTPSCTLVASQEPRTLYPTVDGRVLDNLHPYAGGGRSGYFYLGDTEVICPRIKKQIMASPTDEFISMFLSQIEERLKRVDPTGAYVRTEYWPDAPKVKADEVIVHRMDVFEIDGKSIGPLILTLKKSNWDITVNLDSTGKCHRSTRGWIHPNVMAGGRIYWGNSQENSPMQEHRAAAKLRDDPHQWLHYAVEYLRDHPKEFTGYHSGYHQLSIWTEPVEAAYVLNVKLTTHNGTSDECWGVFTSREGAEGRLISPGGITWHADGEHCKFFEGHRNTDCDDHFPGLVEASATIDKHIVQE